MRKVGLSGLIISIILFVSCKQEVYFNITTKVQPENGGSIIVSPSSSAVLEGTSLTFKASPNSDYFFTGWSGGLSGTENPKTIIASSDLNVVANFTLKSYPLTLSVEGDGAINERVISTKTDYGSGAVVELTANPAEHWLFDHWEGDLTGNTNPIQITVSSAKSVKAVFVKKMYDLTIEVQGEGAVNEKVVETKSGSYQEGTIVELTAKPSDHWIFDHWEGDISGKDNPTKITISSAKKVKAVFVEKMYPLTVEIEGNGAVNEKVISTKSGSYQEGTIIELTANPGEHWVFDHWEGNLEGNQNPVQVTIMSAQSVKAVFVEKMYPLTVEIQGGGAVKEEVIGTKSGSYQEGSLVQLTATPNTYWAFDHWEGDINGTDNPAIITISGAACVKAVFVENDPGIVFTETEYVSPQQMFERLGLGVKVIGQLECEISPEGIISECNPKITQQYFDVVKKEGIKTVCIPVTWLGKVGPAPDYLIDKDWMERVAEVVGYAEKSGLNASIDLSYDSVDDMEGIEWQQYSDDIVWLSTDRAYFEPAYRKAANEKFKAVWTQIARRFRDKGDFLMFHCFTEPGSGVLWDYDIDMNNPQVAGEIDVLNERYQIFVDAVRSTGGNNANRWLVLSPATDIPTHIQYINKPDDYVSNNRIIYSFHFFDPGGFTKDGVCDEWGHTSSFINEDILRFNESFIADLFRSLREDFIVKEGIPVVCTEFGCTNRLNEKAKAYQLYWYEYVIKAGSTNGIPMYMLDCGIDENVGDELYISNDQSYEGFNIFGHASGKFMFYGQEIVDVAMKAMYSDDPSYTLQSIYNRAPFYNPADDNPISIEDPYFKSYLVGQFDKDDDGEMSKSELRRVLSIDITTDDIQSLQGIEYMENLRELRCMGTRDGVGVDQGPGLLTSLDVSHNPRLRLLWCNNNYIPSLDLSNNPELEDLCIRSNGMTELDISQNVNLLWYDATFNKITTLDLSNNPNLRHFYHCMNGLTAIDGLSGLYDLEILSLNDNLLSSFDVSYNSKLKELYFYNNDLTGIDLRFNSELTTLACFDNPRLTTIRVHAGHQFARLEKDDFTQIVYDSSMVIPDPAFRKYLFDKYDKDGNQSISSEEVLDVKEMSICTDDIKDLTGIELFENLETLVCEGSMEEEYTGENYYGQLHHLNVSQNTKLRVLKCSYNKLKEIDVSNNSLLEVLHVHNNDLEKIDISKNPLLKEFICRNNHLTELNITNNTKLEDLDCQGSNHLSTLDVSNCPEIHLLNANGCGLEAIDVSHNPALSWFGCANSKFEKIDLSSNPNLYCLYIDGSKIKWIDLTSNLQVEEVYARSCPNLEFIYLKSGQTIRVFEHDEHTQIVYR